MSKRFVGGTSRYVDESPLHLYESHTDHNVRRYVVTFITASRLSFDMMVEIEATNMGAALREAADRYPDLAATCDLNVRRTVR